MIVLSTPSAGGSSSPIVIPNVIHVTTAGNDTTGDGTLAKPYLTLNKALLIAPTGLIHLGVGSFTLTATNDLNSSDLTLVGSGIEKTLITISAAVSCCNIRLNCNDLNITEISNVAANGADGMGSAAPGFVGGSFELLLQGHNYRVNGLTLVSGNGGAGAESDEYVGDPAAVGGIGGPGGNIAVRIKNAEITGTAAFSLGAGGLSGNLASPGSDGELTHFRLYNCNIRSGFFTSAGYDSGGCGIDPSATIPNGGLQSSDYISF